MKAVVLYDTAYGNTRTIAEAVASGLGQGAAAVPVGSFNPDAARKMAKALAAAGAGIVGEPMAFYVKGSEGPLIDGEAERATAWAAGLAASMGNGTA